MRSLAVSRESLLSGVYREPRQNCEKHCEQRQPHTYDCDIGHGYDNTDGIV